MNDVTEVIRQKMNRDDRFCAGIGIQLVEMRPGYAVAEMAIREDHRNGIGIVQGGALYTLADFAFAGAANAGNESTVSLGADFHYLHPGRGSRLRAVAQEIVRTRKTTVCEVKVFDDAEQLIACGTMTGFVLGKPFVESSEGAE